MSAAVGGSIENVSIAGRLFSASADADVTRKIGGFSTEVLPNGDGSGRLIKTRYPWSLDGVVVEISDARADHEFLQEIADGLDWVAITISLASGIVLQAKGTISGDIASSTQSASCTLTLSGPGTLTQQ